MNELQTHIKQGSKSFYFATLFMPRAIREDLFYLYRVCRQLDDTVDVLSQRGISVKEIMETVERILQDPKVNDFFTKHQINEAYLNDLAVGVLSDLEHKRYQDFDELYYYCYQVAGTVGRMITQMLGVNAEVTLLQAEQLGVGMQLTNIIRDIEEDLERNLFFIPQQILTKHDVTEEMFASKQATESVRATVSEMVDLSRAYYQKGSQGITTLPRDVQRGIRYAWYVYSGILDKVEQNNYDPFQGRVYLTGWEKVTRVVSYSLRQR